MPGRRALLLALLLTAGSSSAATVRARLGRPHHGLQIRTSPIEIAPGTEREVCELVALPNRRAMEVRARVRGGRGVASRLPLGAGERFEPDRG